MPLSLLSFNAYTANPYTDCGIGAALFPNTSWAAVTSNVIWDVGTTAVISATASDQTCSGEDVQTAQLIHDKYELLETDLILGEGDNLLALSNSIGCNNSPVLRTSLKEDMKVISLMIGDANKKILCLSENGYGKQTRLEDFPSYNRGGQGVIALKTSERNGKMVSAVAVDENDGIMLISDKGTLIRTAISQIPTLGRNTQGVKVITPKDGEKLIEGVRIPPEEDEEETADID